MKRLSFLLVLAGLVITTPAFGTPYSGYDQSTSIFYGGIEDGWYIAMVKYSNYSTGTRATYTLKVKVVRDRVVEIDFGNGGSVHSGYNSHGYYYSGGYLRFDKDIRGNIIGASTRVTISDNGSMRYYDIELE